MSIISSKHQLTLPVEVMRAAGFAAGDLAEPRDERASSCPAVNDTELLVGPLRHGKHQHVQAMLNSLSITIATIDAEVAERAAAVRDRTNLKLPDAYALATAIQLEHRGREDVRLATFDKQILHAHAAPHPDQG